MRFYASLRWEKRIIRILLYGHEKDPVTPDEVFFSCFFWDFSGIKK